jgi:two-component system, sensor histidine kinase and response regulator
MRILIIEDEQEIREEISDILKFEGHDVIPVSNGHDGIKAALTSSPDIVICDILMPQMDGFEVLQKIKENASFSLVPFIFVSAIAEQQSLRKGMDQGADDYLFKPFTREELLNAIESHIQKSKAIKEQLDQLKKNIIYTLPHEFRTPLNGIIGFSKIIKDDHGDLSDKDIREMINCIHKSGNRLYQLIQKYLMFIDLEMNTDQMARSKIYVSRESMAEFTRNLIEKFNRPNDLTIEFPVIKLDVSEQWFYFALNEIIDNAFKFSKPGQKVLVKAKKNETFVDISIHDEGIGFSPGNAKKINAFVQFEHKALEKQGTGLGLFLAKRIINLHEGQMHIEDLSRPGTVVHLKLPLAT